MGCDRIGPYLDRRKQRMIEFVPKEAQHVLDVGCLGGAFGQALKEARPGIHVEGIEAREDGVVVARERLDDVVHGMFPDAMPPRFFDCVVFNDVLEHAVDPWAMLERTHDFLGPGGVVVASIPNVRHYSVVSALVLRGAWDYQDAGILDRTHLRFFTRSTVASLFESTGYDDVSITPNLSRPRVARLFHALGTSADGFLAVQYAVVARSHRQWVARRGARA
jgi:trans-aconitate methyltransferase